MNSSMIPTGLRRAGLALTVALALAGASGAGAATVGVSDGTLSYGATPGEINAPRISTPPPGGRYFVTEGSGAQITASPPCGGSGGQASCPIDGVSRIDVIALDGNDQVAFGAQGAGGAATPGTLPTVPTQVDGGAGNDSIGGSSGPSRLIGGPGKDTISGGLADDTIEARDDEADTITCGDGTDAVTADPQDTVAKDCEQVDNGIGPPPAGPVGISINSGDQFTNDPQVTLRVVWPRLASTVFLSNDGGFANAEERTVAVQIPWKLESSGPERLPKTVYARFTGGDSGAETYQDDIILDETAPAISAVDLVGGGEPSKGKTLKLKIKASDATSGVADMQVTSKKSKPGKWQPFKKKATLEASSSKAFVRVRDEAGNSSKWKSAQ
jgi:hypothetical protein